jgi:hypothetical protein
VRTSLIGEQTPEPESTFVHRLEKSSIDHQTENLLLSIMFFEGKFWGSKNEQFSRLVGTEPLIDLFKAWSADRPSTRILRNYALTFSENPPATAIWRSRPRYEFERQIVWTIQMVSDCRPGDDLAGERIQASSPDIERLKGARPVTRRPALAD